MFWHQKRGIVSTKKFNKSCKQLQTTKMELHGYDDDPREEKSLEELAEMLQGALTIKFDVISDEDIIRDASWQPPILLVDMAGRIREFTNGIETTPIDSDDEGDDDPNVYMNIVYIDTDRHMEVATMLGYNPDDYNIAKCYKISGNKLRQDKFFGQMKQTTVGLDCNNVICGTLFNRIVTKRIFIHRGAIVFNMEVKVPEITKPNLPPRFRVERIHVRLFFDNIVGINFLCPYEAEGATALTIVFTPMASLHYRSIFKHLGFPKSVWLDDQFRAFIFECPYNFYQNFKEINHFLFMCQYWSNAYFPDRQNAVTGYTTKSYFIRYLRYCGVSLCEHRNSDDFLCYKFSEQLMPFPYIC